MPASISLANSSDVADSGLLAMPVTGTLAGTSNIKNNVNFEESGTMEIYNPILSEGNQQVAKLQPNSVNINSKRVRLGIGTPLTDTVLTLGNTINQLAVNDGGTSFSAASNASGDFVDSAGIGTGSMGIVNAGLGFTPASGSALFVGVALTNITAVETL